MNTDRIEKTIHLRAPLPRVWRAISDSSEFGAWFGVKFDKPFTPGAALHGICVPTTADPDIANQQKSYEGVAFDITVEEIVPEQRFSFRWHPYAMDPNVDYNAEPTTLVAFTLEEAAGGVILKIIESGFDGIPLERRAKAFSANEDGWTMMATLVEKYVNRP